MTYRPLDQNEYAIVSKTIFDERGLNGGFAESIFMAYKARAMALDEPEFAIFQESEIERHHRRDRHSTIDIAADETILVIHTAQG